MKEEENKKEELMALIRENSNKSFLLLCHHNTDPDALGSAIALARLLVSMGLKDVRIGVAQGVASHAKRLVRLSPVEVEVNPTVRNDFVVILDTASPEQLEPVRLSQDMGPVVLIDHHASGGWHRDFDLTIVDPSRTSTAEIIWELMKHNGFYDEDACKAVLAGIFTDTAGFKFSNVETFRAVWEILSKCDVSMAEIAQLVSPADDHEIDNSRRIAILKACQRMELRRIDGYVVAFSQVSAYEALACKVFIQLGVDVAVVGSEKRKRGVRISARAREDLIRRGLDLGKIMEKVGDVIGGSGGGHPGAAGANGVRNLEQGFELLLREIETFLRNLGRDGGGGVKPEGRDKA